MSWKYMRLQDLRKLAEGTTTQDKEQAVDVGPYNTVVVQVRIPVNAATSGTLTFEHAAVLDDDAFVAVQNVSVDLDADSEAVVVIENPLRFLRWTATLASGETAQILIDLIGRS